MLYTSLQNSEYLKFVFFIFGGFDMPQIFNWYKQNILFSKNADGTQNKISIAEIFSLYEPVMYGGSLKLG